MMVIKHDRKSVSVRRAAILMILCSLFVLVSYAQQVEVKLFAHRGGAHEYDENTIGAFQETYKKGLRGFETDVRRTKDGHMVIFHDADMKRIVGREEGVEDLTLAELKQLRTKKGGKIPTLDELLEFFSDKPQVYIEFEMKTNSPMYDEELLKTYCDELYEKVYSAMPPTSNYVLTSFDTRPLRYLKATYPSVDLLLIKGSPLSQKVLDEAKALNVNRVGCNIDGTSRAMVKEAKQQGFKVSLWPGHSVDDFLLGISLGGDYLCSDVPVAVTNWVSMYAPWITLK